jgi:hypothetical protein
VKLVAVDFMSSFPLSLLLGTSGFALKCLKFSTSPQHKGRFSCFKQLEEKKQPKAEQQDALEGKFPFWVGCLKRISDAGRS